MRNAIESPLLLTGHTSIMWLLCGSPFTIYAQAADQRPFRNKMAQHMHVLYLRAVHVRWRTSVSRTGFAPPFFGMAHPLGATDDRCSCSSLQPPRRLSNFHFHAVID